MATKLAFFDDAFYGDNAAYIEEIRKRYAADNSSVPESWRRYFAEQAAEPDHDAIIDAIAMRAKHSSVPLNGGTVSAGSVNVIKQKAVDRLVSEFRFWGARDAAINPLEYDKSPSANLSLLVHGLGEADMDTMFITDIAGMPLAPLRDIVAKLRAVYCGTVASEVMHISNSEQRQWLLERFEAPRQAPSPEEQKRLLERLIAAETLEKYIHTRYIGQKRFSLEGGDALIPLLDTLLLEAGKNGVVETIIGMAHRGRLNVLVNTLGKRPSKLFMEFEGKYKAISGSGDVKYHMGFSSTLHCDRDDGNMHLALMFNPSHLEIVNPVVEGSVRARQERRQDTARKKIIPVLVHGDAAFAGQGVVMEGLNFSQARGFKTGGTIHIIVNNQIGFTTSTPDDARSTFFCTDIAKMAEIPIIHVNGDDIDGLDFATKTAFAFRQKFGIDIVIDLVCFRRHGHNEQDEPLMTQPLMYQKISHHPGTPAVYAKHLLDGGVIDEGEASRMTEAYREYLNDADAKHPRVVPTDTSVFVDWKKFASGLNEWDWTPKKPLSKKLLQQLGAKLTELPEWFTPHQNLKRLIGQRQEMMAGRRPLDWGMAENLSYATLLQEGISIRLSGQDCGRGTFSHRHSVWHDQKRNKRDGGNYVPLRELSADDGKFLVIDSILSEEAVLGFEYGYATTDPNTLVLWEAQFGDFANGAQVVIDQFIAAGEAKWGRYCGLVMLLPHGYEGQGPEHSSARLERYLQLCAEYNIQVCVPSSPAQIFHLLRRQVHRSLRRPLIVISPKSLLRHPEAVSSLDELASGRFEPLIGETDKEIKPKGVKRLVFCAGKIYYEVRAVRRERKQNDVALCRLEQLYPFPHDYVKAQIKKYGNATQVVWCQEEPGNQGAWHRIQHYFRRHLKPGKILTYALRPSAASPAAGYASVHKQQQQHVIEAALDINSTV